MIPAPPRLVAQSKYTMEGPKGAHIYFEECRVYACDDDGTPMIVSQESSSGLVRATQCSNYRGLESAKDVPTLLAEVERLTKELADERTQHQQTVHERNQYKQLYETLCTELQAATARVDTARAEGQASAYQDAADRVARMRWENPGFFWSTYLSISDTLRDLAEQARKVAYAPDTESPDDDV